MKLLRCLWSCRSTLIVLLTPLVLLPLPIIWSAQAGRCAYVLLVMAIYWLTEALPIAATALLPLALMPLLGVAATKQIATNYFKDTTSLLFGGMLVALAVEKWNLHKRIALNVLVHVGSQPRWLMFGFMAPTAFLSMWISNTATTAMMLPIAAAVLDELRKLRNRENEQPEELIGTANPVKSTKGMPAFEEIQSTSASPNSEEMRPMFKKSKNVNEMPQEKFDKFSKGITICVAYAANIGGTATITGSPTNLVGKGLADTLYGHDNGLNFNSWFIFAFPNMVISLFVAWIWLQLLFFGPSEIFRGCRKKDRESDGAVNAVIRREYDQLGPMTFAEVAVLVHFIILGILWFTRDPGVFPGWGNTSLFQPGFISDGCVAIIIGLSLFVFPSTIPNYLRCNQRTGQAEPSPALLDWGTVNAKMSWDVVLVVGGGFALADSCQKSGLSAAIGREMVGMASFPTWALVFMLCTIASILTEVTSNVATATIFLPILAQLATSIGVHPFHLMIPCNLSTSFAFMLPVATAPNALAFAYGKLRIIDMVKAGMGLNVLCLLILQVSINVWGVSVFKLNSPPSWVTTSLANVTDYPIPNTTMP